MSVNTEHNMSLDLSIENATRLWDELATRLDEFLNAWLRDAAPPPLAEYLPEGPPAVRRMTLNELIKADQEQRSLHGQLRLLEDYICEFPELLVDGEPPCDLIYEEFHLRRMQGDIVAVDDYARRFPRCESQLRKLVGVGAPVSSMALHNSRAHEELEVGQRIDDFELLAKVGRGAFATVFLARQVSMQRLVALKVSAERGSEPQTMAQLDHPHIVRVYDQRHVESPRLRLLYMQYAPGGTLHEVVQRISDMPVGQRQGRVLLESVDAALIKAGQIPSEDSVTRRRLAAMDWTEAVCRLGAQLAQALDYAHRHGVLHRDVKPANVLLSAEGAPKLADFNVSSSSQLEGSTPAAYFGGSLAYMSPEQLEAAHPEHERRPEELDGRSDLFSLAVLLWELMHGERPYRDDRLEADWSTTIQSLLDRRRKSLISLPPGAPDGPLARRVRQVLARAMSPDRDMRPENGSQLARELYLCLQPRAWDLVFAPASGLLKLARRHPILALAALIMPPNILGGAFNWIYNWHNIISPLGPNAESFFLRFQFVVNATFFPVGIAVLTILAWPLNKTLQEAQQSLTVADEVLGQRRRLALRFGHYAAIVGISEWSIAGFVFPVGMHWGLGEFPVDGYVHFFFSSVVCGAVAAAYPFFGATYLALRAFYPALLGKGEVSDAERRQLTRLARQSVIYLMVAGGVPLLGLLLLVGTGVGDSKDWIASMVLILAGIAGMLIAFMAVNSIRTHVETLATATRPAELLNMDTESVELM